MGLLYNRVKGIHKYSIYAYKSDLFSFYYSCRLGQSAYVFDCLSHVMTFTWLGQHGFVFHGLSLLGHSA